MKVLEGKELQAGMIFIELAANFARQHAACLRSKCGSVIISKSGELIGHGWNSRPASGACVIVPEFCIKDKLSEDFKSDKTCCVHAEQRAIMNALRHHPMAIRGSRLYFIRLDETGNIEFAGKPYCTICSKMALDTGLAEFVLYHKEGLTVYGTMEYNTLSFQYGEKI
jgi:deoxycytidylate deaminase